MSYYRTNQNNDTIGVRKCRSAEQDELMHAGRKKVTCTMVSKSYRLWIMIIHSNKYVINNDGKWNTSDV